MKTFSYCSGLFLSFLVMVLAFEQGCNIAGPTIAALATVTPTPVPISVTAGGAPVPVNSAPPASGLFVVASFAGSVMDLGSGPSTVVNTLVTMCLNQQPVSTAGVTLNTPSSGVVPCSYLASYYLGSYWLSQYGAFTQYAYVPGGTYSVNVATSGGSASGSLSAPGGISFDSNGYVVTASNPGNYDAAVVARIYPAPTTTYVSSSTSSVGYPFSFSPADYNMGGNASPVSFSSSYCAAQTIAMSGATGVFVGAEVYSKWFVK